MTFKIGKVYLCRNEAKLHLGIGDCYYFHNGWTYYYSVILDKKCN